MRLLQVYLFIVAAFSMVFSQIALATSAKQTAVVDLIKAPQWCKVRRDLFRVSLKNVDTANPSMVLKFTSKSKFFATRSVVLKASAGSVSSSTCLISKVA